MCAKADYVEGYRVLAEEVRRMLRNLRARWQRRATGWPQTAESPARSGR